MFEKKFAGLKTFREFDLHRCFNGSWTGEADESFRLGENQITERRKAGCYATHRRVGEDADVKSLLLMISSQGSRDLGHLHQGQNPFVHSRAAPARTDDDKRKFLTRGSFDQPRKSFTDNRSHAPHDEGRVGHSDCHSSGAYHAGAGDGGVG